MNASPISDQRTYRSADCVVFRKTNEEFGGLSNMAPGFPLRVNAIAIGTSEVLYQLCRYPHMPDVQRLLLAERSPMTAKMKSRPYRSQSRPDFDRVKVAVMRWCLRVKIAQNWDKFSRLLLSTGERSIVEYSAKDRFWGAGPEDGDTLIGRNALGRLLMELRSELRGPQSHALRGPVEPPAIENFCLLGAPIATIRNETSRPREASLPVQPPVTASSSLPVRVRVLGADGGIGWPYTGEATLDEVVAQLSRVWDREETLDIEIIVRERASALVVLDDSLLDSIDAEEEPSSKPGSGGEASGIHVNGAVSGESPVDGSVSSAASEGGGAD